MQRTVVSTASAALEATGSRRVPGYGLSAWRQNVALVESIREELSRQYTAEQDCHNEMLLGGSGTEEATRAEITRAVDLDFLGILDTGVAHLCSRARTERGV